MRNLKKFLALVLAMIMVVSAAAVVSADFTDVTADNRYADAINDLAVKGIVKGTTETTFGPTQDVERYQMALFMARALTGNTDNDADYQKGIVPFTDVTEYAGAIEYNYVNGIINGWTDVSGKLVFAPKSGITYVQALKMAVCALGYTAEGADWTWAYYNKAAALGLTNNMDITSLDDVLNRAETAQIIYNMLYAVPADGGLSIAEKNFDIQTAANTTTFVITATPKQYYAKEYTNDTYDSASDVEGDYVGIQKLVGGLPTGDILYYTCEQLGIAAAEVENYFNRAVELINFDEATKDFTSAVLGDAPKTVTYKDVTEYKKGDTNNQYKLTIDGTLYTVDDMLTGATLINELVIYAGNTVVETAKMLVVDEDGYVIYGGNIVGQEVYSSAAGSTYYVDYSSNKVITESAALAKWGVQVIDEAAQFAKISTIPYAYDLYNDAYELDLYDDDRDGLYERAVYTPIYMGVYYTYLTKIAGEEREADGLLAELGYTKTAKYVTYTDKAAQVEGAISVFTYNPQLNVVDVIDVLEVKTGELGKVNARSFSSTADSTANTVKLTLDGKEYIVAYDMLPYAADEDKPADGNLDEIEAILADKTKVDTVAKWSLQGAQLGAYAIEVEELGYDVNDLGDEYFLDLFNTKTELYDFIQTLNLGETYAFVEYNGYILMATQVKAEEAYNFAVVDKFSDFDLGELYLDLYIAGKLEEDAVVTEIAGYELANLSSYKFSMVLSEEELYYPGTIYTLDLAEDNSAILDKEVKKTNFFKFDLLNVKLASDAYAIAAGVDTTDSAAVLEYAADVEALDYDLDNDTTTPDAEFTITFDNAKSESAQKANLLRTDDDTIFYFINFKTWDDLKKSEKAKFDDENGDKVVDADDWALAGHPKADEKIVSVYVGEPEDGDWIKFGKDTQLWADKLGRGTADENGVANLVFVIDAVDHTFFTTAQERVHVLMNLTSEYTTEVVYADEIGLDTEEYEEKYYAYYGNFVNLEDGSKVSVVYTEDRFVKSQTFNIIEIDENGVAVDPGATTAWGNADGKVQGARNYALYGIADVNTTQASTAAHANWGKSDLETSGSEVINYFDWLYCHKMKLDYVDCEKVPTSILDVELVADIIEIDIDDDYYVIDVYNGTAWTTLCDEDDKIDTIKVVDLSNLGAVKTGDDAIEYLANSPVICWMTGEDEVYFEDGCIVFIVGTQIGEF